MFALQVALVQGRGGITAAAIHYARMLRAVGVDSATVFRGPARDALSAEGIDVIGAPPFLKSSLGNIPLFLQGLRQTVRARSGGQPFMLIVHSDLVLDRVRRLLPEAVIIAPCHSDKFARKAFADLIITLNPAQHEVVRAGIPRARVALLGNPYVAKPAPFSTASGPPRINFVGRFVAAKDPLTLLRAAALTNRDFRPEYRFIGSGPLETELRRAAAGSSKKITFTGWMASPIATFHQNDVLVLPSVWEGLPYLLQEALHQGVPIIASDIPGNRAALDDGRFGLLFPHGEAAALARTIETALSNLDWLRSRSRMGGLALRSRYGAAPFWFALNKAVAHSFKEGGPDAPRSWRAACGSVVPRLDSDPGTTSLPARKQERTPNFLRQLRKEPLQTDG